MVIICFICAWTLEVVTWTCFFLPDRPTPTFPDKKKIHMTGQFFLFLIHDRPTGQNRLVINPPFKESTDCRLGRKCNSNIFPGEGLLIFFLNFFWPFTKFINCRPLRRLFLFSICAIHSSIYTCM